MQHVEKVSYQKRKIVDQALEKEKQRLERLSILATTVPYYENIQKILPNIHKTTFCRKSDVYDSSCSRNLMDFQRKYMPSFSNERLFSDKKFRLSYALHEAGVANSSYARDIVKKFIPRMPERTTGIEPA